MTKAYTPEALQKRFAQSTQFCTKESPRSFFYDTVSMVYIGVFTNTVMTQRWLKNPSKYKKAHIITARRELELEEVQKACRVLP